MLELALENKFRFFLSEVLIILNIFKLSLPYQGFLGT